MRKYVCNVGQNIPQRKKDQNIAVITVEKKATRPTKESNMLAKEKRSVGNVARSCQNIKLDSALLFADQDGMQFKVDDHLTMVCSKKSAQYVAKNLRHKRADKLLAQPNAQGPGTKE